MTVNLNEFLIPGEEVLAEKPGFRLVGRDEELRKLAGILMRRHASNVLIVGAGGVGCSTICLGLQASKNDPQAPLDIVGKRIFWLDTDGLFASGDHARINDSFQRLIRAVSRTSDRDTVLIIEDARVFIDASRSNGCPHFINSIMRQVGRGRFQLILETRDEDLEVLLKAHPDVHETFTMVDVQEPDDETLHTIVADAKRGLEAHHKIRIDESAVLTAIDLTNKYRVRDLSLSRAQPERTINLIDRALATYRQDAHTRPPTIRNYQAELDAVREAMAGGGDPGLVGLGRTSLEALAAELRAKLDTMQSAWMAKQEQLREFSERQRQGEALIRQLEADLEEQIANEARRDAGAGGEGEAAPPAKPQFASLAARAKTAGFGSREVERIKRRIAETERAVAENRSGFEDLTAEINSDLKLTSAHILAEFSVISGIPVDTLSQDERLKLLHLEDALKGRVFGQDHAMDKLAAAVRVARAGLKDPDKPQTAFLYAGPSGVGKTETAKALTAALMNDERALVRFDMSEYMEKHAVAKLIGAPPGYEGYEAGGILTNTIRRNPHVNILFDEIEKAHPDVFNVLLQVLDDGRLTDNRGLTMSFSETNIIMTTNIGQTYFLDPNLTFEQAVQETLNELDRVYRPEFLNRFNGRENIVCFNRLDLAVIERIAKREIGLINQRISSQASGLSVAMDDETIAALCRDKYDPARGARGIPGFFNTSIYPAVATTMLEQESPTGVMVVRYDPETRELNVSDPQ